MSGKRRVFDIDFPEDPVAEAPAGVPEPPAPSGPGARRGPMASAISETAEALSDRHAAEAAIREENDQLAHEFVRLKKLGLIVDRIPLDAVRASKLTRDRSDARDPELDDLKASIKAVGLSNPIRVEEAEGGFELIQGYRRLAAYRELHAETGDEIYATIPAGLVARGETMQSLYRRMVDENLVRRDISFAEMAQLAWSYLKDNRQVMENVHEAVEVLYKSASRQKRSHIRTFAVLIGAIGPHLKHPEALPRALGTDLVKAMEGNRALSHSLTRALDAEPDRSAERELAILRDYADRKPVALKTPKPEARTSAKTTFRVSRPEGQAKCTAADGRVELRLDRDFTAVDRARLEAAVTAFFKALDD
ncbi:ParB/RepB/Spo0J family partition protein [Anianabacter salinae]|uniref:ParB/RepB/Spo0J family partition protein n=1 Tax=Anianabacter salinae TaxID=2851023 RepID=UPI00225E6147|nr:ParB/RepB/Spo0J family partition protein [Anianabacter salinae]MBV0914128.1 ParB/RepB/Spo0J family partition protein [Anianabacter salinae]